MASRQRMFAKTTPASYQQRIRKSSPSWRNDGGGSVQLLQIRQILGPAAHPLVRLQVLQADQVHRYSVDIGARALWKSPCKLDTGNRGKNFNSQRRYAHSNDVASLAKHLCI